MGVLRRFKSMKGMFSKHNAQQNISTPRLDAIADDDEFEEYEPAAFEAKSPEVSPVESLKVSSDDQFVQGAWRSPRPSVRLAKSSGHSFTGQGRAAVSRVQKRPESGQWEVYDPATFETTPSEVPGANKTPLVTLASSNPSKAVHNMPSPKVFPQGSTTKLGMAESATAAGRVRSSPRNDFVAYAEKTLSIDDSAGSLDSSPRRLSSPMPSAIQNTGGASPRRLASPKPKILSTAEPSTKTGQPIQRFNQSNWLFGDSSTQQAVGQGDFGGWAAFDAVYKAKFGEAIPPSGTATVARKLRSPQPLVPRCPKDGNPDPTVEALTATLTLHSGDNTALSHRLATPQTSIRSNLGNKSQDLPSGADQPLKEWPFTDLRMRKTASGDHADPNFRLPTTEPAPVDLKEWPFKGFRVQDITDRDRSGSGHRKSGLEASSGVQSSHPASVDQSTIYHESTSVVFFHLLPHFFHSSVFSLLTESESMEAKTKIKTV